MSWLRRSMLVYIEAAELEETHPVLGAIPYWAVLPLVFSTTLITLWGDWATKGFKGKARSYKRWLSRLTTPLGQCIKNDLSLSSLLKTVSEPLRFAEAQIDGMCYVGLVLEGAYSNLITRAYTSSPFDNSSIVVVIRLISRIGWAWIICRRKARGRGRWERLEACTFIHSVGLCRSVDLLLNHFPLG